MNDDQQLTPQPNDRQITPLPNDQQLTPQNGSQITPQPDNQPAEPRKRRQPETIGELQQWYDDHNLPPEEVTRFFIGKNITEPKAFGIYENEQGEFVVYKNKANGERAIRYQGPNEGFAVSQLLTKLREEIAKRKGNRQRSGASGGQASSVRSSASSSASSGSKLSNNLGCWSVFDFFSGMSKKTGCFLAGIAVVIMSLFMPSNGVPNGYYHYNGQQYYHQGKSWYSYNAIDKVWAIAASLDEFINRDNADQYRLDDFDGYRFEDTEWYDDGRRSYSDDDDDSWSDDDDSWSDDDSWDSDDTDWDDDW